MKKITLLLSLLLVLASCSQVSEEETQYEIYKTMYQNILNTTSFSSTSQNFAVSASMVRLDGGEYRYDIFIDNAKIAMYDIEILAIVDEGLLMVSDQMMPSVGIFGQEEYAMIPYQVNADLGYVEGFNLNGVVNTTSVILKIQITWKDYFKIRSFKENISLEVSV